MYRDYHGRQRPRAGQASIQHFLFLCRGEFQAWGVLVRTSVVRTSVAVRLRIVFRSVRAYVILQVEFCFKHSVLFFLGSFGDGCMHESNVCMHTWCRRGDALSLGDLLQQLDYALVALFAVSIHFFHARL